MNVTICTKDESLNYYIEKILQNNGFNLLKIDCLSDLYRNIPFKSKICLIDEKSYNNSELLQTLYIINKNIKNQDVIIATITNQNKTQYHFLNGVGVIYQNNFNKKEIISDFFNILMLIKNNERRKAIYS